jgi:cytochrome c-type biogenesis protein
VPIASIGAGLLAGILSTLSPCVFPLLPLVIGAATSTHRSGAYWLAGGVATSFTAAGGGFSGAGDRIIRRLLLTSATGQFVVGVILGLVWSPCVGPTLGAASLLAAQRKDLASVAAVMFAFGVGTTLPMLAVAVLSRTALFRWRQRMLSAGQFGKVAMGLSAIAVGAMILTGVDRRVETALVIASPAWLTDLTTQF